MFDAFEALISAFNHYAHHLSLVSPFLPSSYCTYQTTLAASSCAPPLFEGWDALAEGDPRGDDNCRISIGLLWSSTHPAPAAAVTAQSQDRRRLLSTPPPTAAPRRPRLACSGPVPINHVPPPSLLNPKTVAVYSQDHHHPPPLLVILDWLALVHAAYSQHHHPLPLVVVICQPTPIPTTSADGKGECKGVNATMTGAAQGYENATGRQRGP
ncbi:hypothetical protein BDZ97DRAFT_2071219 [Flammula alnicola]|nr:hypothetical protein BDZ97DRAFT_2081800 [Flammula alnicola]KAF8971466.1 hypothetical protein BDZ97DRAFT_2071219 [Flammula alnicola]